MDNELHEVKKILSRRKKGFVVTFLIISLIGIVVAIALPPIYKSEATIRLEDQQISEDFVRTTIPEYIEEQAAKISQQVLNREELSGIVKKLNLFTGENKTAEIAEYVSVEEEVTTLVVKVELLPPPCSA